MNNTIQPSAPILVESLRAFGYSLETAIADLIDNSISADATEIWIDFHWNGSKSAITITDNGHGIPQDEMLQVMKFGSKSPDDTRHDKDLGRFGLGLKTSSLSQAKSFTVCSKTDTEQISSMQWDIDHIKQTNDWTILIPEYTSGHQFMNRLKALQHGTVVIWEKMDRVVSAGWMVERQQDEYKFIEMKLKVQEHVSMVFHRYLEGIRPSLKIYMDNIKVEPWDPFCEIHNATHRTPEEIIPFGEGTVSIKGFVLPHKDKLTIEEYDNLKGPKGWNGQQGFYIYRNRRMLVSGSWLGLGDNKAWTKEEQYKLARIRIDIPNSLDSDWSIDVKKSTAKPPLILKDRLMKLAQDVRTKAREVFAHRGQYKKRSSELEYDSIWQSNIISGQRNYYLDRNHPLVKLIQKNNSDNHSFEALLKIIEQTVPVERIWLETAEKPENHAKSFESLDNQIILETAKEYMQALMETEGLNKQEAIQRIIDTDGFRYHTEIIKQL